MSKLFLMAGTKGGIGKTLVATLLADAASDAGYRSVLFDCDEENKSLFNAMSNRCVEQILERYNLEENSSVDKFPLDRVANRIFQIESDKEHYPGENVFGIDLKAGSTYKMLDWMKLFPFEVFQEQGVEVYIVGIVTNDSDSVMTYLPWIKQFDLQARNGLVNFLTVLNRIEGSEMPAYHKYLKPYLEKKLSNAPVVILENLNRQYMMVIRAAKTSYGRVGRAGQTPIPELQPSGSYRIQHEFINIKKNLAFLFPAIDASGGRK